MAKGPISAKKKEEIALTVQNVYMLCKNNIAIAFFFTDTKEVTVPAVVTVQGTKRTASSELLPPALHIF